MEKDNERPEPTLVCGLCIKTLHKSVKSTAEKLHGILVDSKRKSDARQMILAVKNFTDALENLLVWVSGDERRDSFLFYGFGPMCLYGQTAQAIRHPVLITHLNTNWLWQHWKYHLGKMVETGTTEHVNADEARTLSSMFWPWRVDDRFTGSMSLGNGETFVFEKCHRCKELVDIPEHVKVRQSRSGGKGLFTTRHMYLDEQIFQFGGVIKSDEESTAASLQVDDDKFLESQNIDNFLNHSCDPNCYIDWESMWLRSRREINPGEELTYDYNTSDWDNLSLKRREPAWFICQCGSGNCSGKMIGFKHLSETDQRARLSRAAPYIKRKVGSKP